MFEPLRGRRVGYVRMPGNVGDAVIEAATLQLFAHFGVDWRHATLEGDPADEYVIAGGGNMGPHYAACRAVRRRALATGLPVTVLPQSFTGREDEPYARVFVRGRASLRLYPRGVLAPNLALGLAWDTPAPPRFSEGVWLRRDAEARFRDAPGSGDPIAGCRSWQEYLGRAADYAHVVTDRLHFAVAGLIGGRQVTLVPNSYHKNRAIYETWLGGLGCRWADSPPAVDAGLASRPPDLSELVRDKVVLVTGNDPEVIARVVARTARRVVVHATEATASVLRARLRRALPAERLVVAVVPAEELPLLARAESVSLALVVGVTPEDAEPLVRSPQARDRPAFPCWVLHGLRKTSSEQPRVVSPNSPTDSR